MMFGYSSQLLVSATLQPFSVCQRCPLATSACRSQKSKTLSFYDVLGVSETATHSEIKDAFIKKSKELHPDVNPRDPELHKVFIKVTEAYNTLSNSTSRQGYDAKRNSSYTAPSSFSPGNPFGSRDDNFQYHRNSYYSRRRTSEFSQHTMRPQQVKNPYNKFVIIGTLLFMLTGAAVHSVLLKFRHQKYQARVEESTRKANQAYTEAKERAKTNGLQKQLELLTAHHAFHAQATKTHSKNLDSLDVGGKDKGG